MENQQLNEKESTEIIDNGLNEFVNNLKKRLKTKNIVMSALVPLTALSLSANIYQNVKQHKILDVFSEVINETQEGYEQINTILPRITLDLAIKEEIKQNIINETGILAKADPDIIISKYFSGENIGGGE